LKKWKFYWNLHGHTTNISLVFILTWSKMYVRLDNRIFRMKAIWDSTSAIYFLFSQKVQTCDAISSEGTEFCA
jgi:hypothetical protein